MQTQQRGQSLGTDALGRHRNSLDVNEQLKSAKKPTFLGLLCVIL